MFVRGYDPVMFSRHTSLALVLATGCAAESELALLANEPREDARVIAPSVEGDGGVPDVVQDAAPVAPPDGDEDDGDDASPMDETIVPPAPGADAAPPPSAHAEDGGLAGNTSALVLRYDFSGSGTELRDRVGDAHARVLGGAKLDDGGVLDLDGRNDYVDLPNGVLSSLTNATIVVWFERLGGYCWERVFDFGSTNRGEGYQGEALTSLFFTPQPCGGEPRSLLMAEFGGRQGALIGPPVNSGLTTMVAVTFEGRTKQVSLYQDGVLQSRGYARFALTQINDINSWLGRSQWIQDFFAQIRYDEFRIYGAALSASEVAQLADAGPDAL